MNTTREKGFERLSDQEKKVAREIVSRIQQRFDGQLVSAILFGSRARGESESESDMDVAVVLSAADARTRKEIRHLAVEVWLEHGIYPSTRVWSLAHWRRLEELGTQLYQNIQLDGIELLGLAV